MQKTDSTTKRAPGGTYGADGSPPFAPGDKVTTDFNYDEAHIVRQIEMCVQDARCGSGWRASADCGGVCPHCQRPNAKPVRGVDSTWFTMVNATGERPETRSEDVTTETTQAQVSGTPFVRSRSHYHAMLDRAMDQTKQGESLIVEFVRIVTAETVHEPDCALALNFRHGCTCGANAAYDGR